MGNEDDDRSGQRQQRQDRGFEQPGGQQGLPQQEDERPGRNQTQQPRPTWGERPTSIGNAPRAAAAPAATATDSSSDLTAA